MTNEDRRKLEHMKNNILEGTYSILQEPQWDQFSRDLANCGANLLKEIELKRDKVREFKASLLLFHMRGKISKLNSDYEEVAKTFDLFFDASMRWLKCIINRNEYKEYQILQRKYVESLTIHCSQTLDYLGNLVSSKRNEYYHYQAVSLSLLAILIAVLAIIIGVVI